MRRRRSREGVATALAVASLVLCVATPGEAQKDRPQEGALFVLLPVGARSVAVGQAVVAEQLGSEAVWWNPAALARSEKREAAIHHSQTLLATGDALTILIPSSLLGVAALSVNIIDYGQMERTEGSEESRGSVLPRDIVYAATYGAPIGARVNAGITYKLLQVRLDCSADCSGFVPSVSTTTALDFGFQYDLQGLLPITIGTALRNVGLKLQVKDEEQSDPLPTRLQLGVLYRLTDIGTDSTPLDLHLSSDVTNNLYFGARSARFGADLLVQRTVHLRAGYNIQDGETGGPSIGVGLVAGNLLVDVARVFERFSAGAGQAPTYLSLRYLF